VNHTSDEDMDIAQANIQAALNNASSWTKKKRFQNITGKDSGHAHMQEQDSQPS
jgi:hypothetical protein